MTRRFAVLIAFTLLLLGGCGDNAGNEFNKGRGFAEREDWDTAIACYTEAIRLKPGLVEAYNNRGIAYRKKGDKAKADADVAKAKELAAKK